MHNGGWQMKREPSWEHFEHMADIGVRGFGSTPAEAFAQAALAMTGIITQPEDVQPDETIQIQCDEEDLELLLVDWLNAVIFEMATRGMLFSRFEVQLENGHLQATLRGEKVDRDRHLPAVEIKGATYTELAVRENEPGRWVAQCVVDV